MEELLKELEGLLRSQSDGRLYPPPDVFALRSALRAAGYSQTASDAAARLYACVPTLVAEVRRLSAPKEP